MTLLKKSALALALAGSVAAQSSVVSIFFPDADEQALVGSIIKSDSTQTTIAVGCPSGEDQNDCGFADSITVTVGPSTFRAEESFESLTVELDCVITGSTAATCKETYVGPADLIVSAVAATATATASEAAANTQITTTAVTTTLSSSDIAYLPVTITAGPGVSGSGASSGTATGASASASSSASAASATASSSTTTGGSSTSSGSATPSIDSKSGVGKTDSRLLAISAAGAGLLGLIVTFL